MSVPDEVRHDAEKTGGLVRKKLMEIMELQADIGDFSLIPTSVRMALSRRSAGESRPG